MDYSERIPITREIFEQREQRRLSLFSQIWTHIVPKVFEDVPRYYRPGNIVASLGLWELWVWQFVRTINLFPQCKVLDVCAGTNSVGIRLLRIQPDIIVTAIDRSREMQAQGMLEAQQAGFHIKSVIQDVHHLPFPDNSFDMITLQAASRHLQMDRVLPEIHRVLKPGGWLHHCDMLRPAHPLIEWFYLRYLRVSLFATASIFGSTDASRNCGKYFVDAIRHFYTLDELSDVLHLVGFTQIRCKKSIWGGMVGFHAAQKDPAMDSKSA